MEMNLAHETDLVSYVFIQLSGLAIVYKCKFSQVFIENESVYSFIGVLSTWNV